MGNVSIFENGQEVFNKTFGPKNNADSTKYAVGSITKIFTGVLIAQMFESNKIDYDEELSDYFPQVPNSNKITIKHMLNHTSGLKDYVVKNDSLEFWLHDPVGNQDIMNEIIRQGADFQPGDSLSYSNSAYYLLAKILEQKTHKPFRQMVAENIANPLGLKNTFGIDESSKQLNLTKSYEKKSSQWQVMEEFFFPNTSGAGDIISNAHDLNRFVQELFSEQLIKSSTLEKMLPVDDDWFGLGIMKIPFHEYIAYGHGGDTEGTHCVTSYNPNNKLAISSIINGQKYPNNNKFAKGLVSIIYDKDFELPEFKEYIPEKRFLELYKGTYGADDFPMNINIYLEENHLKAQAEGQDAFILSPTKKHIFEFAKGGIEIEFKPSENKLILKQAGQVFELIKQ
jgi:D-alanyl-D-alanine carboxypeptidase